MSGNGPAIVDRLRSGEWLEPRLVAFAACLMLAGTVFGLGFLVLTANGNIDQLGRPLGTDFSSFWAAGRMALDGLAAQSYDWTAHAEAQKQAHGSNDFFPWSYPPLFLLVVAPLATLPYLSALLFWQAASAAAAAAVLWRIIPNWRVFFFAAAFPGVLLCFGHGQTGFLTGALLAWGVLLLPRREWLAGVCFGLLAYKPQFGLLIPLVLVAGGYWRAIFAAALTVGATVGLTFVIWGWPVWQAFLDSIPLTRTIVFETGDTGFHKFQSIFAAARLWGGSVTTGYALQIVVTLFVSVACVVIWRTNTSQNLKGASLLTGVLLSSPYVLDYDFIVFGLALAFLAAHAFERGFAPYEKSLLAFAWFVPAVARGIAQALWLPIGFITLASVFVWIILRALEEPGDAAQPH